MPMSSCQDFNSYHDFQIIPVSSMLGSHFLLVLHKYLNTGTELLPHSVSKLNQNANAESKNLLNS